MTQESIKSKIEKLFKKAESANELGSLEEAGIFMAKAQELLVKHNIEQSELNLNDEEANPCIFERIDFKEQHRWVKTEGQWLTTLYAVVSQFNFCKVVAQHGGVGITLVGEKQNTEAVIFMCSNIIPKLHNLKSQRWKEYQGMEKRNAFFRGYLKGAAIGIYHKLNEQREKDKVKYSGLTGIVKLNDAVVDEAMAEQFGKLKTKRPRRLSANSAMSKGVSDGKNLQLNKGVSGGKAKSTGTNLLN